MKHLVLVGPMGAGKTTVGRAVAARLGRTFVDTDELIVATAAMSVAEVFVVEGERGFRERERIAVADACATPEPAVISCGGGAVLHPDSRAKVAASGFVVWLDAPGAVLAERVASGAARPLLATGDPIATLERIRSLRADAYAGVADSKVDTQHRTIDEVVDAVLDAAGDVS